MPKLRILCQMIYPELVSTGQTMTELCEALVAQGVDVEVVAGPMTLVDQDSEVERDLVYKGIRIHRVWGTRFPKLSLIGKLLNHLSYAFSIYRYLKAHPDKDTPLLVLTNPPFLGWITAFLRKRGGNPYHYLVFDLYPDTAIECGLMNPRSLVAKLWYRFNTYVYNEATHIITIGRCMTARLTPFLSTNDQAKLCHIHMWCDPALQHYSAPEKADNRYVKQWNLSDKFVLSYSGNLARFHDIETFLKAAVHFDEHDPDITFLFVGEGHKKQWAQAFAKHHQLSNCQFHTYVPRDDLPEALSAADVGLVSLLPGHEGLSVPSKTYGILATGTPVLGLLPDASEIAHMIRESGTGKVVKPGDVDGLIQAITALKDDVSSRLEMGINARQLIVNHYTAMDSATRLKKVI